MFRMSFGAPHGAPLGDHRQRVVEKQFATGVPLDLSARRLRYRRRRREDDMVYRNAVMQVDRPTQPAEQRVGRVAGFLAAVAECLQIARPQLAHDGHLRRRAGIEREHRAAAGAEQLGVERLDRRLDVVRIMIRAANQHHVLQPPGDEHFGARPIAVIAGAQESPRVAGQLGLEGLLAERAIVQ